MQKTHVNHKKNSKDDDANSNYKRKTAVKIKITISWLGGAMVMKPHQHEVSQGTATQVQWPEQAC